MDIQQEITSIILSSDKTLVFTSETVARNTLNTFLLNHEGKAVFKDRFISWDRFLLSLSDTKGKRKVTDTERMAFVSSFIKKHGASYLSYFVDSRFSESIHAFTRYISHILPFFPSFKEDKPSFIDRKMIEDIERIRPKYEEYLRERNLYEERYLERDLNRIPEGKIVLVYPESFTSTFTETVIKSGKVEVINIPEASHLPLHEYKNSISEIKGIMRMIERDLKTFMPQDIAITSSSLDTYRPYLEEEAKKRDIPLLFTSNLPLTSYPEGKLLKLFDSITKSHWGLKDFKKLVSDPSFPFKDRELLLLALHIGVDMKMDGGGYKNWMRVFDIAATNEYKYKDADKAKALFDSLYKSISLITKAKNSLDIENRIREFRNRFFIENEWNEKDDRIFGTALEILEGLKELDDDNLYSIYLSILKDTTYVENSGNENGIKVYSYPASASLCTKRHYIIGLDDKSTSLKIDDYPFTQSNNKPEPLDIGKSILSLYSNPSFSDFTYISGTANGYDGSRLLPTIFLDSVIKVEEIENDSYIDEGKPTSKSTKSQSDSYKVAKETVLKEKDEEIVIQGINSNPITLSVSEVKSWDTCPFKGYAQSILKLRKLDYECEMEDHFLKGDILHETLQKSLEEIGSFSRLDEEILQRNLCNAIDEGKKKGRIPDAAVESHIYNSIWKKIKNFSSSKGLEIYKESQLVGNEVSFSGHILGENVKLKGRIDTILKDDDDKYYILDYKLSGDSDWSKDNLDDMSLQVILYYMLLTSNSAENDSNIDNNSELIVASGGFYSLSKNYFKIVWPYVEILGGFNLDAVIINANDRIKKILSHIKSGDVTPDPSKENCENCDYKRLCRGRFVAK